VPTDLKGAFNLCLNYDTKPFEFSAKPAKIELK